jgi:hypothetical protein
VNLGPWLARGRRMRIRKTSKIPKNLPKKLKPWLEETPQIRSPNRQNHEPKSKSRDPNPRSEAADLTICGRRRQILLGIILHHLMSPHDEDHAVRSPSTLLPRSSKYVSMRSPDARSGTAPARVVALMASRQ